MSQDRYEGFADRYDLFYGESDDRDSVRAEFFRKLFTQKRIHSVLDCACGTGRDLLLFHSLGLEVYGSDISVAMLTQAQKTLARHSLAIPLLRADYRELPQYFDRQFGAVACLSTSILEMPDETNVILAFKSMLGVLRKGGVLILTQGTTDKQWRQKPRFIPAVNTKKFSRIFVIDYFEKGARYNILDIYHSDETTDFKVWSIDFKHVLLRDDLDRLLKASGFSQIDFFGTYQFEPYNKAESDQLITVATK
jgi:glycine/sarcosine N-methyltransferase